MAELQYIAAGRFIDGTGGDVRRKVLLTVRDGLIAAIGSLSDFPKQSGAVLHDLSHCTLLPALVDCSVALAHSPSVDLAVRSAALQADSAKRIALMKRHISYCYAYGVLGMAVGDEGGHLLGSPQGVALLEGDACIKTSGYVCQGEPDCPPSTARNFDYFRIPYSPDIEAEGSPLLSPSLGELCRIIANSMDKKTVVVANGQQQVSEALEAGCDAIEQGYDMGEDNLRTMAEKKVVWIPSVMRAKNALDGSASGGEVCCRFSLRYVAPGKAIPGAEAFWKKSLARQLSQLSLARELGVATAVGTGAGSIGILHGESMMEEMKLFIKAGYTLEEVIFCASERGARFFGMDTLGALTVGRRATFLITRGTVKQLPRKLSYLEGIYVDGASSSYRKDPVGTVAVIKES
jgi:imidazolonepropionase-like amidohydrolase